MSLGNKIDKARKLAATIEESLLEENLFVGIKHKNLTWTAGIIQIGYEKRLSFLYGMNAHIEDRDVIKDGAEECLDALIAELSKTLKNKIKKINEALNMEVDNELGE